LLIEDNGDAPPTKYAKVHLESLKHETELFNMDWYAIKRFYRLKECYSGLEPDEKPPVDAVHHEIG